MASKAVSVLPDAINRLKLQLEVLKGKLKVLSEPLARISHQ